MKPILALFALSALAVASLPMSNQLSRNPAPIPQVVTTPATPAASMTPASTVLEHDAVSTVVPSFIAPHEFNAYADDETRCHICGHGPDYSGHVEPKPEPFDFNCPTCKGAGLYHGAICPTCDGASNALRPKHLSELKAPVCATCAPAARQPAMVQRQYKPQTRRGIFNGRFRR